MATSDLKNIKPKQKKSQPFFLPKLISSLKSYSRALFWGDLSAGIIVGIVALPLAIAFSIASGVTPNRGLIASIVGGLIISSLGGSRVQIGGATGAFVVIIYRVVGIYGLQGLMICTFMAGVLLILMGVLRWGSVIKFIPYPLTVGFTAGIAVLIATSQVRDFLGLTTGPLPSDFIEKWILYFKSLGSMQFLTVSLSLASLAIILLWPRVNRKIPGSVIAILVMTLLVQVLHLSVATIGSSFGSILSKPVWVNLSFQDIKTLVSPAFTIALLGAIQSLLSATVADSLAEGHHRPNTELIAQGIANLVVPLFGGIPVTGAVARTLTNVKNGGKTPVAGIIHSLFLLMIILIFGRWIPMIPLCVLSVILLVVSYNMGEWHAFKTLMKASRTDAAVMIITFLLTIFVDLTVGVEVGLMMAFALFVKRMTNVTTVREVTMEMNNEASEFFDEETHTREKVPEGVAVYEVEGALFFGVAEILRDNLNIGQKPPQVLILRTRHVLALDATGLRALRDLRTQCLRNKTHVIFSGINAQPMNTMKRSGFLDEVCPENMVASLDKALARAKQILENQKVSPK